MSDNVLMDKPSKVSIAVKLLYSTLAIRVVRITIDGINIDSSGVAKEFSMIYTLSIEFFAFGFLGFFIYMIGKGKNWARVTLLVIFILGVTFSILPMIQSLTHSPLLGILDLAEAIIEIIALVFLFQRDSSAWFKMMKNPMEQSSQNKKWESIRLHGKKSFVVKQGVIRWGLLTAILCSLLTHFILPHKPIWVRPLLALAIFPIGGVFWGLWVWSISEKNYKKWVSTRGNT